MKCVYCGKELPVHKRKYCNDMCKYRFLCIQDCSFKKVGPAQQLRILRASRTCKAGNKPGARCW